MLLAIADHHVHTVEGMLATSIKCQITNLEQIYVGTVYGLVTEMVYHFCGMTYTAL